MGVCFSLTQAKYIQRCGKWKLHNAKLWFQTLPECQNTWLFFRDREYLIMNVNMQVMNITAMFIVRGIFEARL